MKVVPTLHEIMEGMKDKYSSLAMSNIDDVFREIASNGVKEIGVTRNVMLMIAMFMVASCGGKKDENGYDIEAWKVLSEGKVDKFLGVKLKLIE